VNIAPDLLARIEDLIAKQELHELCAGYSRAVDRLDEAAFVELCHADAVIDSGVLRGAPEYFAREFGRWVREHARVISHAVTNEWFLVEGSHAIGESYVIAVSRLRGEPAETDYLTVGRYFDRFERRDGRWKFSERRFVLDHSVKLGTATEPLAELAKPGDGRGAFAPNDPIYRFWPRR
jgi:SnoaL-like domain